MLNIHILWCILYPVCCMLNSECIMPYPDCKCVSRYVHWNYWIILRSSAVLKHKKRNAFYITWITMMDGALCERLCVNARCRIYEYYLFRHYTSQFCKVVDNHLQDTVRRRFTRFSLEKVYKIQFGEGLQDTVWRRFTRFSLEKVCKIHFRENLQETALTRFTRYSSEEVYKIKFGTVYKARTIHKTIAFFSLKFQPNLEIEINKV